LPSAPANAECNRINFDEFRLWPICDVAPRRPYGRYLVLSYTMQASAILSSAIWLPTRNSAVKFAKNLSLDQDLHHRGHYARRRI
jgi:hypothetical protein